MKKANEEPGPQEAARPENGARKPLRRDKAFCLPITTRKMARPQQFRSQMRQRTNAVQDEIPSARPRRKGRKAPGPACPGKRGCARNAEGAPKWRVITPCDAKISGPDLWPHSKISAGGPVSLPWLFALQAMASGLDVLVVGLIILLQERDYKGYALASAAFILLQEGMGTRPFRGGRGLVRAAPWWFSCLGAGFRGG